MSIESSTDYIRDKLNQEGIFNDVTHSELNDISNEFGKLNAEEAQAVYENLKKDGLIDDWISEMNSGGWFGTGGLSSSEKSELFNQLSQKLTGEQLNDLGTHMDSDGLEGLSQAIAEHAPSDTKQAFIESIAKSAAEGEDSTIDGTTSLKGDPQALAAAQVLASMGNDPAAFDSAVTALANAGALERTLAAATGESTQSSAYGVSVDFKPEMLTQIVNAAAASGNAQVKAQVFEGAAEQLQNMEDSDGFNVLYLNQSEDLAQVRDAMNTLIKTDPNGIVNELRTRTDVSGGALVSWTQQMIAGGKTDDIRNLIVQLQQGNDGSGNAYQNFADPNTARTLGYFSGALAAGINNITDNRQEQAEFIGNIFGTAYGAAGAANPAAGVIASIGNGITQEVINGIVNDLESGDKDLKAALYELAIPRNDQGVINDQGTGYDAFNAAYAAVAEANR